MGIKPISTGGRGAPIVERLRRFGDEPGFAVPTVMAALIAAFMLASATMAAVIPTQQGSVRDQAVKAALAAAETGVSEALLHYNRIPSTDAAPLPCVAGTVGARAPLADGSVLPDGQKWCPGVQRSVSGVSDASYTYWVRPSAETEDCEASGCLEIVSQGSVSGVTRKVEVIARSSSGINPFGEASVMGLDFLTIDSEARITADVATNGDITIAANGDLNCNYAQVGLGRSIIGSGAGCAATEDSLSLPPVNQGDVATNNSNDRFFALDAATGNTPEWDPVARTLSLTKRGAGDTTLTLGGSNYSFCTLTLNSNTSLFIAAGANVRIYFDSPENCNLPSGATQLSISSNSRISATGASSVALLFVGSPHRQTKAILSSNTQANLACEQDFVVYAPRTDITMNSNSYFCGALAGKSIRLGSNSDIRASNLASDFEVPVDVAHHYSPEEFRDCAAMATTPEPDHGC